MSKWHNFCGYHRWEFCLHHLWAHDALVEAPMKVRHAMACVDCLTKRTVFHLFLPMAGRNGIFLRERERENVYPHLSLTLHIYLHLRLTCHQSWSMYSLCCYEAQSQGNDKSKRLKWKGEEVLFYTRQHSWWLARACCQTIGWNCCTLMVGRVYRDPIQPPIFHLTKLTASSSSWGSSCYTVFPPLRNPPHHLFCESPSVYTSICLRIIISYSSQDFVEKIWVAFGFKTAKRWYEQQIQCRARALS